MKHRPANSAELIVWLNGGGMDSALMAALIAETTIASTSLYVEYGQDLSGERRAASKLASIAGSVHHHIDITSLFRRAQRLGYGSRKGMVDSDSDDIFVPGRNHILTSIAIPFAMLPGCRTEIWLGLVGVPDSHELPDNTPSFFRATHESVKESTEGRVSVRAPMLHHKKTDLVPMAMRLEKGFEALRHSFTAVAETREGAPDLRGSKSQGRANNFAVWAQPDPMVDRLFEEWPIMKNSFDRYGRLLANNASSD